MGSINETGHAINVANFDTIIATVPSFGTTYNPSKASLKIPALSAVALASKTAIGGVSKAEPADKLARDARDMVFEPLASLATKAINSLQATDASAQVVSNARTLVRKITGSRATPKLTEEQSKALADAGTPVVQISASQMSCDSRIDNFGKFIDLLTAVPSYTPNEDELKVTGLTGVLTDLRATNSAVITAEVILNMARITRDDILYKPLTGMVDIALDVKTYIKSVYGPTSPEFRIISRIKFTKKK